MTISDRRLNKIAMKLAQAAEVADVGLIQEELVNEVEEIKHVVSEVFNNYSDYMDDSTWQAFNDFLANLSKGVSMQDPGKIASDESEEDEEAEGSNFDSLDWDSMFTTLLEALGPDEFLNNLIQSMGKDEAVANYNHIVRMWDIDLPTNTEWFNLFEELKNYMTTEQILEEVHRSMSKDEAVANYSHIARMYDISPM